MYVYFFILIMCVRGCCERLTREETLHEPQIHSIRVRPTVFRRASLKSSGNLSNVLMNDPRENISYLNCLRLPAVEGLKSEVTVSGPNAWIVVFGVEHEKYLEAVDLTSYVGIIPTLACLLLPCVIFHCSSSTSR